MIYPTNNPIEWALLDYKFEEVMGHVESLIAELKPKYDIEEIDFRA